MRAILQTIFQLKVIIKGTTRLPRAGDLKPIEIIAPAVDPLDHRLAGFGERCETRRNIVRLVF